MAIGIAAAGDQACALRAVSPVTTFGAVPGQWACGAGSIQTLASKIYAVSHRCATNRSRSGYAADWAKTALRATRRFMDQYDARRAPRAASWSNTMPDEPESDPQRRLLAIAERNAAAYVAHTQPRAILLTGSVAEGLADESSDIDMIVYHDELPSAEQLDRAARQIGPTSRDRPTYGESFRVDGVECEVGHFLVGETERRMGTVLVDLEVDTLVHKGLMGIVAGRALHGESLIEAWQARCAAFPEGLRRAMAEHYIKQQFAFWYIEGYWATRDARLWLHKVLVETGFNILGILAGVNRLYFSTFQFKRLQRFVDQMQVAPVHLAQRLDHVYLASEAEATREAEQLMRETLEIAQQHLPGLDTSSLRHWPGERGQR
jgi:hypothetical protein